MRRSLGADEGIRISTIDNPGEGVSINVAGTALEARPFKRIEIDRTEADWLRPG